MKWIKFKDFFKKKTAKTTQSIDEKTKGLGGKGGKPQAFGTGNIVINGEDGKNWK